ncbi:hypothetical protein K435DRAFT_877103 [Dendrothele bispora CBS 962.96]|uniref:Uncharacterized protein n=1 Tax=Dendrothele bispora (strain CBS 962.96) TaxID=1314807 RepID=A0A4S8KQM3_DENBC|nr:hypothetical protein K435DRAFT_877103 [Dendrothele bispora CBS 962.96]
MSYSCRTDHQNVQHFHPHPVAGFFEGIRTALLDHIPTYLASGEPPALSMKLTKLMDSWASKLAILTQSLPNHANKYPAWFTGFIYSLSELVQWIYRDDAQLKKSLTMTWILSEKDREKMSKSSVMPLDLDKSVLANHPIFELINIPGSLLTTEAASVAPVLTAATTKLASPAKKQTTAKPAQIPSSRSKGISSSIRFNIDSQDNMEVDSGLSPSSSSTTQRKRKRDTQGTEAEETTSKTKKGKKRVIVRPPMPSESSNTENTPVFELDNILKKASGDDVQALLDNLFEHVKLLQDVDPKSFGRPLKYGEACKDKLTPYYTFHDAAEPPFFIPSTDRGAPFKLNIDTLLCANEHVQPVIFFDSVLFSK